MEKLELRLRAEAAGCALTQQVHARCTATQRGWGGMSAYEGERATGLGGRWWVEEGGEMKGVEGEERKELNARRGRGHTTGEGHEVGTRRVQRFTRTGREREMHREREEERGKKRRKECNASNGKMMHPRPTPVPVFFPTHPRCEHLFAVYEIEGTSDIEKRRHLGIQEMQTKCIHSRSSQHRLQGSNLPLCTLPIVQPDWLDTRCEVQWPCYANGKSAVPWVQVEKRAFTCAACYVIMHLTLESFVA